MKNNSSKEQRKLDRKTRRERKRADRRRGLKVFHTNKKRADENKRRKTIRALKRK